jgi:DNA-binding response OmpR family regulator
MSDDRTCDWQDVSCEQSLLRQRWLRRPQSAQPDRGHNPRYSYQRKLGRETIRLDPIAFRLFSFLAARPYRAYSRRRLAQAISTPRQPVAEEALDRHVLRLRSALGFFGNYIQTVPYIGYRFKA